jgi:type II secretory pathway component GspD/PulD (secretin)
MFRASQGNSHRSELMLLITPHIINPTRTTPVNTSSAYANPGLMGGAQ